MRSLPDVVTVCSGAGAIVAQTDYDYDEAGGLLNDYGKYDVPGNVMPRRDEKFCHAPRQCVVDQKFQAECGSGSSRSMADAAAKRRHSRMSSI